MKELLELSLDVLEKILTDAEVAPELRIEAAFIILEKYCCENNEIF